MTGALLGDAAGNNAEWCDLVCRTHGIAATFDADAWTSTTRTPPLYPDAVTLTPGVGAERLLARIDTTAGCSVKDSFADLDLTAHGFRILFDAQWIRRAPSTPASEPADNRWRPVRNADELGAWERAWDSEVRGLFLPALLEHEAVTVLAAFEHEQIVAGAITNRSKTGVGVSNSFSTTRCPNDARSGYLAHIAREHPGVPIVGYESGDALTRALAHGFTALGPLRVWLLDPAGGT